MAGDGGKDGEKRGGRGRERKNLYPRTDYLPGLQEPAQLFLDCDKQLL